MKSLYTSEDVARVTGCTQRQLRYWHSTSFLRAQYEDGGTRTYSFRNLFEAQLAVQLRQRGVSIQSMRALMVDVRLLADRATWPLMDTTVMVDARCRPLVFSGEVLGLEKTDVAVSGKELRLRVQALLEQQPVTLVQPLA